MNLKQLLSKLSLKKPSIGFWLLLGGFVFSIVGFALYFATYKALGYSQNSWVIAMMVLAFWSIACLLINGLISGNRPFFMDIFYVIAVFTLVVALLKFLTPCLSPIGIYFTVHNMGDVEANAIGVPRAIAGVIFFVLAVLYIIVAAFCSLSKEVKEASNQMAVIGFVFAFLLPIVGLICSIIGLDKSKKLDNKGFGLAVAGIVISAIEIVSIITSAGVLA